MLTFAQLVNDYLHFLEYDGQNSVHKNKILVPVLC